MDPHRDSLPGELVSGWRLVFCEAGALLSCTHGCLAQTTQKRRLVDAWIVLCLDYFCFINDMATKGQVGKR